MERTMTGQTSKQNIAGTTDSPPYEEEEENYSDSFDIEEGLAEDDDSTEEYFFLLKIISHLNQMIVIQTHKSPKFKRKNPIILNTIKSKIESNYSDSTRYFFALILIENLVDVKLALVIAYMKRRIDI